MKEKQYSWNDVFVKSEGMASREIAGELIVVPIHGKLADMEVIFALEDTARVIWRLLDGKNNLEIICNEIEERFDSGRGQIEKDVLEFIDELQQAELISKMSC